MSALREWINRKPGVAGVITLAVAVSIGAMAWGRGQHAMRIEAVDAWYFDPITRLLFKGPLRPSEPVFSPDGNEAVEAVVAVGESLPEGRVIVYFRRLSTEARERAARHPDEMGEAGVWFSLDANTWIAADTPEGRSLPQDRFEALRRVHPDAIPYHVSD